MQNYKIVISYDGTDYHGWQRQPAKKTIQGIIEETLTKISSKKIPVIGSGRTDTGVHALGQVAHFKANLNLKEKDLFRAMNAILPCDINIISLEKTSQTFHARKSAKSKIYQYRILNSSRISPFLVRYVLQWTSPLNIERMKDASSVFIREDDFTSFSSNRLLSPLRKVFRSELTNKEDEIVYTIEANGFLRYMVRTIVGALLEVGKGKMSPEDLKKKFRSKRRSPAIATAPARGLCLLKVKY